MIAETTKNVVAGVGMVPVTGVAGAHKSAAKRSVAALKDAAEAKSESASVKVEANEAVVAAGAAGSGVAGSVITGSVITGSVIAEGVAPEAAEALLEAKRLGERIKFLRQRKQMGLVELGRYTGLSASFLSQLETGRVVPTLRNLARIAMVFSRDLSYFFEPDEPELFRIVRAGDRQRLPQTGADEPGYFFESLGQVPGFEAGGQKIVPYVAEFLPLGETRQPRSHQHGGSEFLYMLGGKLKLTHDGKEDLFEAGDAVYFHADATHSYERVGEEICTALILTMPESGRGAKGVGKVGK